MTGYGESWRDLEGGRLRVEIRTVNHRHLSVQFRAPPGIDRYETAVERALKDHFARGRVNVLVSFDRTGGTNGLPPVQLDLERARAYVDALRSAQEELGLQGSLDIGMLTGFRDLFREPDPADVLAEMPEEAVLEAVGEAAANVLAAREVEGGHLARDLSARLDAMEAELAEAERLAPGRLLAERDRLREAVRSLLDGEVPVDEEKLAREVAHLAERWDIHEEIVRFRSHLAMFGTALDEGASDGVGRRLGFIAQELLREVNTIGSKANDAAIAEHVVALKEEIGRVREQVENVE